MITFLIFLVFRNNNSRFESDKRVSNCNTSVNPWRSSSDPFVGINYSPHFEEQEEKIKVNYTLF